MSTKNNKTFSPYSDPFSPFILMMMFSFFGFIGILFFLTYATLQGSVIMEILGITLPEVLWAFLIFLSYLVFWLFGYAASFRVKRSKKPPRIAIGIRFNLTLGASFLIVFAVVFGVAYTLNPSIDEQFRSSLTSGTYGKFFFIVMSFSLGYYGIFSTLMIDRYRGAIFKARGSTATIVIWLIGFLILSYVLFAMGGRGRLISLIIILVAARHYLVRPITLVQFQFLAIAAIFVAKVIPTLMGSAETVEQSIFQKLWGIENGRTFDGLYNLTVITNWWRQHGAWGFPGELWVGDILGDLGFGGYTGTRDAVMIWIYGRVEYSAGFPATKPGEFLLNFGAVGVYSGGFFQGYLAGRLYEITIMRRLFGIASIPIYITVNSRLGLGSPLGYFAQNVVFSAVAFIILLILWSVFFGAYKTRRMPQSTTVPSNGP